MWYKKYPNTLTFKSSISSSRGKDEPLYSQDEVDMDTQRDAPRTKPGAKKKKKRSIRENSIKTSTPKANPGRHYSNGSMEIKELDGPSGNNNMATIKELVSCFVIYNPFRISFGPRVPFQCWLSLRSLLRSNQH